MLYAYYQNNSGGISDFYPENGITDIVVIEADSCEEADTKAERIGLYFDGCSVDIDCSCCGDRWTRRAEYDVVSMETVLELTRKGYDVAVHLKDGSFKILHLIEEYTKEQGV